jgi:hypothetical protein
MYNKNGSIKIFFFNNYDYSINELNIIFKIHITNFECKSKLPHSLAKDKNEIEEEFNHQH